TLEYISPKAVESNGTNQFEIKAAVRTDSGKTIRSGYSANAEIVLQRVEQALSVSESALEFSGDSTFVWLKGADGKFTRTPVTTGISDGLNIEITGGLKEGDIVRGNQIIEEK
ncbi:MAG: efflux transporter periplasmic adaptor subunit, partial [Bacteroidales bacterium]|nr:efflux transporter periplasmic adaptor subunit [Bacteroidales bacterium]